MIPKFITFGYDIFKVVKKIKQFKDNGRRLDNVQLHPTLKVAQRMVISKRNLTVADGLCNRNLLN